MADKDEEIRRVSSGWGRRPPRPREDPGSARPLDDPGEGADAGAISGRAATRSPQDLAPGDTLGGAEEPDANLSQADPLSGNPPRG